MAGSIPLRATHYVSGETIRAGDRVEWAGRPGVVEFVLGPGDPPSSEGRDLAWFHRQYGHGFMLQVEGFGPVFQKESGADLTFVGRAEG
jgi:hypothetical protein